MISKISNFGKVRQPAGEQLKALLPILPSPCVCDREIKIALQFSRCGGRINHPAEGKPEELLKKAVQIIFFISFFSLFSCGESAVEEEIYLPEWDTLVGEFTLYFYPLSSDEIESVYVAGGFNDWVAPDTDYKLTLQTNGAYTLDMRLNRGTYCFNFFVNGEFVSDLRDYLGHFSPPYAYIVRDNDGNVAGTWIIKFD